MCNGPKNSELNSNKTFNLTMFLIVHQGIKPIFHFGYNYQLKSVPSWKGQ